MCLLKRSHAKWIDGETVIYERRWATNQMNVNTEYWWILLLIFRHLALSESCLPMPNSMFQSWGVMGDCQDVNGYSGWFLKHSSVVSSMVFKEGSRWYSLALSKIHRITLNSYLKAFSVILIPIHMAIFQITCHLFMNYCTNGCTVVVNRFSIDCSGMYVCMDGWMDGWVDGWMMEWAIAISYKVMWPMTNTLSHYLI